MNVIQHSFAYIKLIKLIVKFAKLRNNLLIKLKNLTIIIFLLKII